MTTLLKYYVGIVINTYTDNITLQIQLFLICSVDINDHNTIIYKLIITFVYRMIKIYHLIAEK